MASSSTFSQLAGGKGQAGDSLPRRQTCWRPSAPRHACKTYYLFTVTTATLRGNGGRQHWAGLPLGGGEKAGRHTDIWQTATMPDTQGRAKPGPKATAGGQLPPFPLLPIQPSRWLSHPRQGRRNWVTCNIQPGSPQTCLPFLPVGALGQTVGRRAAQGGLCLPDLPLPGRLS